MGENLEDKYLLMEKKGKESERKVFQALEELKREGKIKDFGQSFQFSQEDVEGIDFIILPQKGKAIYLQVKSTFIEKKKEKYERRGIAFLAVEEKKLREIKEELIKIIKNSASKSADFFSLEFC